MLNVNVKDYGAVGDGKTMDTQALQAAIDAAAEHNGGRVTLEDGVFLTGMIVMKSGVELHIERDAVLLGSADGNDFPDIQSDFWRPEYAPRYNRKAMIYAENADDLAITGRGVIDCNGQAFVYPKPEEEKGMITYNRYPYPAKEGECPFEEEFMKANRLTMPINLNRISLSPGRVVFFIGCRNVLIEDVTMRNQPAGWSYWICDCDDVHITRAKIKASVELPNNDGLHINCCRNVTISDCNIECGDDAIVIRAYSMPLFKHTACEKVTVTNCNLTSHAYGIRLGWYGDGVIRNCSFSNLTMTNCNRGIGCTLPTVPGSYRGSDEGDEEPFLDNLTFSNITMDKIYYYPILLDICENTPVKAIQNLYFSGIHAFSAFMPKLSGRPDALLKNIYFDNCHFTQMTYEEIGDRFAGYMKRNNVERMTPQFRNIENLVLNNTVFTIR